MALHCAGNPTLPRAQAVTWSLMLRDEFTMQVSRERKGQGSEYSCSDYPVGATSLEGYHFLPT